MDLLKNSNNKNKESPFSNLQKGLRKNVIIQIFSFLNGKEILKCALVSKEWKKIALSDAIWKQCCARCTILKLFHIQNSRNLYILPNTNLEKEIRKRFCAGVAKQKRRKL